MRTREEALQKVAEFKAVQPGSARFASLDLNFEGNIATAHHMMSSRKFGTIDIENKIITTSYAKGLEPLKTVLYFFYDAPVEFTHIKDE
jgi:hypothetical protein